MICRATTKEELKGIIEGKIPVYDEFRKLEYGFYEISKDSRKGLLNSEYELIVKPLCESFEVPNENVIITSFEGEVYMLLSKYGYPITSCTFAKIEDARAFANFFA